MDVIILKFVNKVLNKCSNITIDNFNQLNDIILLRDCLLDNKILNDLQEDIVLLRKIFSSTSMTCLHKNSIKKQQFPLLNLLRQILKTINYNMVPIRKSNGYTKSGQKKYLRFFHIIKY